MNLPNRISLLRIMLVPVMAAFVILGVEKILPYGGIYGAVVFLLASLTDGIDGYIARSRNLVTTLGKFLDSIADKILCMVALVLIVYASTEWMAALVSLVCINVAREFFISALRQIGAANNVIIAADKWGKLKAVFQYISFPILMLAPDVAALFGFSQLFIFIPGFVLYALSTVLNVVAAVHYIVKYKKLFQEEKKQLDTDKPA